MVQQVIISKAWFPYNRLARPDRPKNDQTIGTTEAIAFHKIVSQDIFALLPKRLTC